MNERRMYAEVIAKTLAHVNVDPLFKSPDWLHSDFNDCTWLLNLNSKSILDFRVRLEDDSLLVDEKNSELLLFFKRFLVAQTSPQFTKGATFSNSSITGLLGAAIRICEYMLVRAEEFKLGRYGLSALPSSFSHRLLHDVSMGECADAIYQFDERVTHFLRKVVAGLSEHQFAHVRAEVPSIARPGLCDYLDLSEAQLQRARAWLWINDYYELSTHEGSKRFVVNTSRLCEALYSRGTLRPNWTKPVIDSLVLGGGPLLSREFPGVPVRGEERAGSVIGCYVRALRAAVWMGKFDPTVPRGLIEVVVDRQFAQQLPLAGAGRYTTVPHSVVLKALRHAIEFSLEQGPLLLSAYLCVVQRATATKSGMTIATRDLVDSEHPDIVAAGIECWSLPAAFREGRKQGVAESNTQLEEAFFHDFRRGAGLYEQMQVLWGCLLLATGTVMARRQGELLDLKAGNLFDASRSRLKFHARKRNVANLRECLMRPAPTVIIRMMTALEKLQSDLICLGLLKGHVGLLSFPDHRNPGLSHANYTMCNKALDRFCDFFEVAKDDGGRRYYIRQHQLRRFFAMLFFWGNSFSGLETLRWFLGHIDVRNLYHYITESTPGEVLSSVKVDFAIERLREADASVDSLANVINAKLNTTSIQLLDNAELAGVIRELLEAGDVHIEPQFFKGHSGEEYTILITVERGLAT